MAKFGKKIQAFELRKKGESILSIAKILKVSKSSVSIWCRDIKLTDIQIKKLEQRQKISSLKGRMMGVEANKRKKEESVNSANFYGKNIIGTISSRDLALISTALYWGEGSKDEGTSTFMFVNSDPQMIYIMHKFLLSVFNIKKDDIKCRIQINIIHKNRVNEVLNFWKNLLDLKEGQIKNPYFVKTKAKKIYKNHNNYFGVCRLSVKNGKYTKYKILGMISALKNQILSA